VLLISANTQTITMPTLPLGLGCVAAATRNAGHEVALLNLMFEADPESSIIASMEDFRPHVIGISIRNIDNQNMQEPQFLLDPAKEVVATCRSFSGAPIILGGAGYSIFPESALRYLGADMGIQGEGEVLFPFLLDQIRKGEQISELPGIHFPNPPSSFPRSLSSAKAGKRESTAEVAPRWSLPRPGRGGGDDRRSFRQVPGVGAVREPPLRRYESNLDALPLPEPSLWIPSGLDKRNLWVPVQSRRGCDLDCAYCSTALIEGRPLRSRSAYQIVKWLKDLRQAGYQNFNFVDNTFNLPPAYAKDLCRQVIEAKIDLNFWCIIYPKWIDSELVQVMQQAGCSQISFGFESGSDRMLRSLNKQFDAREVSAISRMFAEAGIERMGFLLLGGPGETKGSVEESLSFADSLHLETLKIAVGLRIYPHTPLARTALAEGVIRPDEDLLLPRFYLTPELRDWLPERTAAYMASRAWVM
jgi:radical SAM superfamily enzyme YgiQ (UPF0313 family)